MPNKTPQKKQLNGQSKKPKPTVKERVKTYLKKLEEQKAPKTKK